MADYRDRTQGLSAVKSPAFFWRLATVLHHLDEGDEMQRVQWIGQKFGTFLVLEEVERYRAPCGAVQRRFICRCDCGRTCIVWTTGLRAIRAGRKAGNGCKHCAPIVSAKNRIERSRHGGTSGGRATPVYRVWASMRDRCHCPTAHSYPWYGARGITICDAWQSFPAFRDWAMANGYQEGLTIERKDVNGHYEPGNCEWITRAENVSRARRQAIARKRGGDGNLP